MLKVASFKMSDAEGINKLLTEYRLADKAGIFVSNGEVMIPYEDGTPLNNTQKAIALKEDLNKLTLQIDVITHSNNVMQVLIERDVARLQTVEADIASAEKNREKQSVIKPMYATRDAITANVEAMKSTVRNNEAEIARFKVNCEKFAEKIAELEA